MGGTAGSDPIVGASSFEGRGGSGEVVDSLKHFLERNIGRPWDKVYSEICNGADARVVMGRHVLDHVADYVAIKCWLDGKRVMWVPRWGGAREVHGLYVHSRTGLLKRTREAR